MVGRRFPKTFSSPHVAQNEKKLRAVSMVGIVNKNELTSFLHGITFILVGNAKNGSSRIARRSSALKTARHCSNCGEWRHRSLRRCRSWALKDRRDLTSYAAELFTPFLTPQSSQQQKTSLLYYALFVTPFCSSVIFSWRLICRYQLKSLTTENIN